MRNEIIKTALLGTDRYQGNLKLDFSDILLKIKEKEPDKEAVFLKQSATYFMMQSASFPLKKIPFEKTIVFDAQANYISDSAQSLLQRVLINNESITLNYCFYVFRKNKQLITPYLVPDVIEKFENQTNRLKELMPICGEIGKEVLKINGLSFAEESKTDIETAGFADIKDWIRSVRTTDPQKIWEKEDGEKSSVFERIISNEKPEKRCELLELLEIGIAPSDEIHLNKQLKSRSKNIKEAILKLLILIDGSQVQNDFSALLKELLSFETQKHFLGLKQRKSFVLNENHVLTPEQKAYGLEEISSEKGVLDALHHLCQCISLMPISLIAKTFDTDEETIFEQLFVNWKNQHIKKAFKQQAIRYKQPDLIQRLLKFDEIESLAQYLPFNEAETYFGRLLSSNDAKDQMSRVTAWLFNQEYREISDEFAKKLIALIVKQNVYLYANQQLYELGLHFPISCKTLVQEKHDQSSNNEHVQKVLLLILQAMDDKWALNK